jgi:hypothetical protein
MTSRRVPFQVPRLQWVSQPQSGRTRIAADQPCQVRGEGADRSGIVFNISELGLYLLLDGPLPGVGEELQLSFALPDDSASIACAARVAWQNPPSVILRGMGSLAVGLPAGCGLEFVQVEDADRERIQAYVATGRRRGAMAGIRPAHGWS